MKNILLTLIVIGIASCSRFEVLLDCKSNTGDDVIRYLISNQELKSQGGRVAKFYKTDAEGNIFYRASDNGGVPFYIYNRQLKTLIIRDREFVKRFALNFTCIEVK